MKGGMSGMKTHPGSMMLVICFLFSCPAFSGVSPDSVARALLREGFVHGQAFNLLRDLTREAPLRLSGSPGAARAVTLTQQMMRTTGFAHVRVETVMVPHWVRGAVEKAKILGSHPVDLSVCALGGSVGTPPAGITAGVIEVQSFEELQSLRGAANGKIVFFNRPMDPALVDPFEAYGGAVSQRSRGAVEAARVGGVAAIVRSMTCSNDDVPHTGAMGSPDSIKRVPAAAISIHGADLLSAMLRKDPALRVRLRLECATLPDAVSGNVLGELTGTEFPEQVIIVGGHLDSWDKGSGAHDDGAGCVQAIEAVRLLREIGIRPRRTIRAVMFMNEENGVRGGRGYAASPNRNFEKHIAAIESDRGGFAPRGVSIEGDSLVVARVRRWQKYFDLIGGGNLEAGHGGVDISPIVNTGTVGFGLLVDRTRYFDFHHSANDTIDKVHPRELEHGAIVMAMLLYLLSEEGL
jgi:carboxypeptidase Q